MEGNIKIISLKEYARYKKKLSQLIDLASNTADEIENELFTVACLGKWKEWDKSQPVGARIYVDEEMLRSTGDKNIDLLWEILDKIREVKEEIENKQN